MIKKNVQQQLAGLAKQILQKHRPKIVGITGSVGKTSTRDAIAAVLKQDFKVRSPKKNFNNEFGLPFAILGVDTPGRNPLLWLWVFIKGYLVLWIGHYPEVLVLEMGVDRVGDMDYLLSIAPPDIAVLTAIGSSHYQYFQSMEAVAAEKSKLIVFPSVQTVIINADNDFALAQQTKVKTKIITYGKSQQSVVKINILEEKFTLPATTYFKVDTAYSSFESKLFAVGTPHLSAAAAAVAVGLSLNMTVEDICNGLLSYRPVPGRLNFIQGIKQSTIIEDSYNASPESTLEALQVLSRMPQTHKVAVLGDMLELGDLEVNSHKEVGQAASSVINLDWLIGIGPRAKMILESAISSGYDERQTKWFEHSTDSISFIKSLLEPQMAVLIKGSQGVRMEIISKELLAEPSAAAQLLPRQYGKWLND